jgi:hypothetical protein
MECHDTAGEMATLSQLAVSAYIADLASCTPDRELAQQSSANAVSRGAHPN